MAVILSSTKSTTGSPYVYYEVSAEEVAGTRTADSVQIKWGARARLANADSSLGTGSGYGIIGHLKINGTEVSTVTIKGTSTKWSGNSWHNYVYNNFTLTGLSATQTTISSITFNATRTSNSSSSAGYMTAKNCSDVTITTGFQKSSFESGATSGILGTGQTIQIKSVSDSFTHQLRLKIGNDTYDIDVSNFTTSGLYKDISWTPSYNYANYNTDGNTVYGQLELTTSGGGTTDTTTSNITLTIPDNSTTKSGISISTSDSTNLLATYDKYVQNKSVLVITPTFTSKYNSWARRYYYEIKANDDSGTILAWGDGDSNDSNKFYWTPSYVGTVYIKITLTDSRYFTSTNDTTINTAAYNQPSSSRFNCERDANTSSTINCYIKANGENVNNKNVNSVTYKLYYKKTSSNTWSEYGNVGTGYSIDLTNPPVKITSTDTSSSYDIKLTAWDSFTNETQIATDKTPPAFTLMNFNASGKAMAIGKVSEATGNNELLEIGMNTNITGTLAVDKIDYNQGLYFKEDGYGDKFKIVPYFNGADDNNILLIQSAVGGADTDPALGNIFGITALSGNIWSKGSNNAENGFYSKPDGNVDTQTPTDALVIKRATYGVDNVPNTGVVLEYGRYSDWGGQLLITDNTDTGLWWNGWSNGTRGTWKKLAFGEDTGWQHLTTTSDFQEYAGWGTLQYRKCNGVVSVVGILQVLNTTTWNMLVTTLPAGCRPPIEWNFVCRTSSAEVIKVYIGANGEMHVLDTNNANYLSPGASLEIATTYIPSN